MPSTRKLGFLQRNVGDVLVLELVGELALDPAAQMVRQELYRILEAGHRKVLLNLAGVSRMDSTGVGVLLAAKTSAINRDAMLKLCCVPPLVAELLARLQLNRILDTHEQESQALESFR